MKVSICMTYYNRSEQLRNTLASISKFTKPHEIIIVDDASDDKAEKVIGEFPNLPIVNVYVSPDKKWWMNPCIPFNMAFKLVTGDNVIIQNAECLHHTDVVGHVSSNVSDGYHAFATYSQAQNVPLETIQFTNAGVRVCGGDGWYNHSVFRPKYYHFCAAMSKENLFKVGGFDEEFANGFAYDDDAFVRMIHAHGIKLFNDDNAIAIHQFHYSSPPHPRAGELCAINQAIYARKYR